MTFSAAFAGAHRITGIGGHPAPSTAGQCLWGLGPFQQPPQRLSPDVNEDGSIDVSDVQLAMNARGVSPPAFDLNNDGMVTLADVQIIVDAIPRIGLFAVQ